MLTPTREVGANVRTEGPLLTRPELGAMTRTPTSPAAAASAPAVAKVQLVPCGLELPRVNQVPVGLLLSNTEFR